MPSKEKKEKVKQIRKWFEKSDSLLVLRYKGIRVAEANKFRVEIKNSNAELRVLKNTLTRLALAGTTREEIIPLIDGPIAVVFTSDDVAPLARVIKDFSRGRDELFMMGGVFQGTVITAEQAERLATLPPRDVILARMVGQVAAPISGLIGVCVGPLRKMLGVMAAFASKKEKESGAAGAETEAAGEEEVEQVPAGEEEVEQVPAGEEEVEQVPAGEEEEAGKDSQTPVGSESDSGGEDEHEEDSDPSGDESSGEVQEETDQRER